MRAARARGHRRARCSAATALYVDGLFFGIVDDDVLYLRVDDAQPRRVRGARPAAPFEFMTQDGKRQAMSYLRAPDEALDSADAMRPWLRSAMGAALRAASAARPKRVSARANKT